jgi:hypothetical protein
MWAGSRRFAAIAVIAVGAVVFCAWLVLGTRERDTAAINDTLPRAEAPRPPDRSKPSRGGRVAARTPVVEIPPAAEPAGDPAGEVDDQDAIAAAWASIDLDAVRQAMPDNLYFQLAAPTQDEAVLAERAAERERWNAAYGKILSGTGSEDEIRAYYDQRARLSTDYVEFTTYLLDHHRDTLPERDTALLELARRMHAARLEEIPRKIEEAFARKRQQDEARAAWLADEAEFGAGGKAVE